MHDYELEIKDRVSFLRGALRASGADGFVYGNSGGKDSALAGILLRRATENTLGLVLPCGQAFKKDMEDALAVALLFEIETRIIELTEAKDALAGGLRKEANLTEAALINIAPRLRMTALYAVAASENRLVAGTDNRSEIYMGYYTKWGDGAYDINPIADLTVTEVYEFLRYFKAPESIIQKAPSAGLFEGQTDELEMGVTYRAIDAFLTTGRANEKDLSIIERFHSRSEHKRRMPLLYAKDHP